MKEWFYSFARFYPRLLEAIIAFGDVVQTLVQTLILSFGLTVILVVMLIVEHHGIYDGLTWFLTDTQMAFLGALGFVLFNLVIEFQVAYVEDQAKYREGRAPVWSLRLLLQSLGYRLGIGRIEVLGLKVGKEWRARQQSPARRFLKMRTWVTLAIFVLALSGRMKEAINKVSETETLQAIPLAEGLQNLQNQSSLADAVTWVGGTLFTMVALIGVQGLTAYIAGRVISIKADMKNRIRNQKAAATRAAHSVRAVAPLTMPAQMTGQRELQPIRVKVGSDWQRKCPQCGKVMSRQAWAKHPCRFTEGYAPVVTDDGAVVAGDDAVDTLTVETSRLTTTEPSTSETAVKFGVNSRDKSVK